VVRPAPASFVAAALLACGAAGGGGGPPGAGSAGRPAAGPLPLAPVRDGAGGATFFRSGYRERARLVIRGAAEWADAWRELWAGASPAPPLPAVDFSREMVFVAAMGEQPSGGHSIAVASAAVEGGRLRVKVVETSPGPDCMVTMALTQPAAAVRLPRFDGPVEFAEGKAVEACR
jgi:PrcB C-terminal